MSPRRVHRLVICAWRAALVWLSANVVAAGAAGDRFELVWPTPSTAWAEGRPPSQWLQHAGSGDPDSGGFGGVRSGGRQFHEGIDIRPVARDRSGSPTDSVFAAMRGVVRHISNAPGNSGYGRYVVLEHPELVPAVYSLYAHLARIAPGLRVGDRVDAGGVLGTMGHSSGGYMIPKDRAHLHFEIGLVATQQFQAWYNRRKFGSRNEHGMWNGMNLLGIDPLAFFDAWRARRIDSPLDFFQRMEPVVRLRTATYRVPDFITRYPALLTKPMPLGPVAGWEIQFNWSGVPFAWTPLTTSEVAGMRVDETRILEVNAELERRQRSKSLAVAKRDSWTVGKDLETVLQQLFGR
jgi:murein DD-endopeptidase MepM/ murein hydrolase activator NlpD